MSIPDWRRTLKKLRAMDRGEALDRFRQAAAKRSDLLLARFHYDFTRKRLSSELCRPASFFFKPEDVDMIVAALRERLPQEMEETVARAEKICKHRFDLLGFENLDYGNPINWEIDLVHAKQAPAIPFHQVKYLNFEEAGDSKITWELNRHQHLVTLAKAYRLTGERRFADEALRQWRDWRVRNPYPIGINWASSLEVGFRSLSWMWMYYLLEGTDVFEHQFRQELLRAQALNGRYIERYLSTYFSPNTHLLGEGVALFFLGTLCPELHKADRWKKVGWKIIVDAAHRQINPDGFHFEQSTYYHVYAMDFFLHSYVLAMANGHSVPSEIEAALKKMFKALSVLGAAGTPPRFGDDDGGRLFDPTRNRAEHLLDPLSTGAILFEQAQFKNLAENLREETIWLLGLGCVDKWERLLTAARESVSASLECSGIYALASDTGHLFIRGGPSIPQSSGHNHADALSVCLHRQGRALLIDPGTLEYVGPGSKRDQYRGTAMHNTLCIDGLNQADTNGPFSWKQSFSVITEQWVAGKNFDLFIGSHDGYRRLSAPVIHRRWVVRVDPDIFMVRDLAVGEGEHRIEIVWHLAAGLESDGESSFRFKDGSGLAIIPAHDHGWHQVVEAGQWSPVYGRESAAKVVKYSAVTALPAEFLTILTPVRQANESAGTLTSIYHQDSTKFVRAYNYKIQELEYIFFFRESGEAWRAGNITSDAQFVSISSDQYGVAKIIFCNGSFVEVGSLNRLRATTKVSHREWVRDSGIISNRQ